MVRQIKQPDAAEADLENTDELPTLDIASYEAKLLAGNASGELTGPKVSDTAWDESRSKPPAELPPAETLRDIEAWIAAQEVRAQAHDRALADIRTAHTAAQARADNLALELELAQKALYTALGRANDGERLALDNRAAAQLAESRAAQLQTELEETKRELASVAERVGAATTELAQTHESLAARAREQNKIQQRQAELERTLDERSNRTAQVEGELASLRSHIAEANRELAQRAERIAAIQQESDLRQSAATDLAREREALAVRIACLLENAQSNEWKRNVWEDVWHNLNAELTDARTLLGRAEAERADGAATVDRVRAELAERDATIAHLEAERKAQSAALAEFAASRAREQQGYAVSAQELRTQGETLATEIKSLEERYRRSTESVTAREAELAESRAARTALEEMLRTVQSSDSAHAVRAAELEALATNLSHALQVQAEATKRADALIETRERELVDERNRVSRLEAERQAAIRHAAEQSAAVQATETALSGHLEQLAARQERLTNLEREATSQSGRLANLQAELAETKALTQQAEASRRPVEDELGRVRSELQRETERAGALDAAQQKLALELEWTRGALDERELQLRRLERYASTSAQVLSRIKVGIERGNSTPPSETLEVPPDDGATLVPLDDSDAPALPLGRHTTIGRAPESDLCLKDSSVSRRHAVVTLGPKGAFIEDIRSVNGVTVNRRRIRHARLADGDVIELGLRRFRFTTAPFGGPSPSAN
jgi:chromosome segregation ATPase